MWKTFIIVLFFVATVQSDEKKPLNSIYVNAVRCNFSEKYIYKNVSCFAKSFSRTCSTINVHATFKKQMNPFVCFWKILKELQSFIFFSSPPSFSISTELLPERLSIHRCSICAPLSLLLSPTFGWKWLEIWSMTLLRDQCTSVLTRWVCVKKQASKEVY